MEWGIFALGSNKQAEVYLAYRALPLDVYAVNTQTSWVLKF